MSSERRGLAQGMTRRGLFGALAGGLLPSALPAMAATAGPVAVLDYGIASTMLMLGTVPAAVASLDGWETWVAEPAMPASVIDLGSAWEVNFEILASIRPGLILTTPFLGFLTPMLERLAPVESIAVYGASEGDVLARAISETTRLGALIGRQTQAAHYLAEAEALFADCARRIVKLDLGPVALISFTDKRHARIHGRPGLYQSVMTRIGVVNAWTQDTNLWGFQTIGLEQLGTLTAERTRVVAMEPLPADVMPALGRSPLWQSLPFVRTGRVSVMPPVLLFGMVEEAQRFARLLTAHLEGLA